MLRSPSILRPSVAFRIEEITVAQGDMRSMILLHALSEVGIFRDLRLHSEGTEPKDPSTKLGMAAIFFVFLRSRKES